MVCMTDKESMPLPIERLTLEDAVASGVAADLTDPETPLGAAATWYQALSDVKQNLDVLKGLSVNPAAWGDYAQAAQVLGVLSIMSVVEDCPDDPGIKYVKFIHFAGGVGVGFADASLTDFAALTMVEVPGRFRWKVWGLSQNGFPPASQVLL